MPAARPCRVMPPGSKIQADAFHLDPGRRDERTGRRLRSPASWQPPLSCVETLADRFQGGLVKLGPGIPFDDVPDIEGSELEFVSLGGRLSQSHLWLGTLATAPGHRRATMLPLGLTESGPPDYSDLRQDAAFDSVLCVPDPALERSGLHGLGEPTIRASGTSRGTGTLHRRRSAFITLVHLVPCRNDHAVAS